MKHTTLLTLLLGSMVIEISTLHAAQCMYKPVLYADDALCKKKYLSTINISISNGTSEEGFNGDGNTTEILNIYGLHNMWNLGGGLALNGVNTYENFLIALRILQPSNPNINPDTNPFGKLKFSGIVNHFSTNISFIQNLKNGFFFRVNVPIQKLQIQEIKFVDQGSTASDPQNTNVEWQHLLTQFDPILNRFGLSKEPVSTTGIGDVEMLTGWSTNIENFKAFDFLNATIMAGFSCPTAAYKNEDQAFSIATGYDGHLGCPLACNVNIGFLEFLSFGFHIKNTIFFNKIKNMRLMTAPYQNGFIILGKGDAKRKMGSIFNIGFSLNIGPISDELFFTIAYDFTRQKKSLLTPSDTIDFSLEHANLDTKLLAWRRHDLHFSVEYDLSDKDAQFNPKIGLFLSLPIGGKRIFKTNSAGLFGGMSIVWNI